MIEEGQTFGKTFTLKRKMGNGAFGEVWKAWDSKTNQEVALKFEDVDSKTPQLYTECRFYLWLHNEANGKDIGIPKIYFYGTESKKNIMAMELLSQSLEDMLAKFNGCFDLKTVLLCGEQMLNLIEFIHTKKILHMDLKPENFMLKDADQQKRIYLIDFGLSKKYTNSDGTHIKYREDRFLIGNARYSSINSQKGIECSRRDDLESLGYLLIYLLKGSLPWQTAQGDKALTVNYDYIKEKKSFTTIEELGKGVPEEFSTYIEYCRKLEFTQRPDYEYLRTLFSKLYNRMKFGKQKLFCWCDPKNDSLFHS